MLLHWKRLTKQRWHSETAICSSLERDGTSESAGSRLGVASLGDRCVTVGGDAGMGADVNVGSVLGCLGLFALVPLVRSACKYASCAAWCREHPWQGHGLWQHVFHLVRSTVSCMSRE